ncbi:NAD-dependent epimerase/dehydratase family protein [Paraburkholderia bengalensis]|uniref:NAD-dependent epimerase/dehydratase family protein n=1 Tax=Paraburkholderia bengalensis TaxID=2747562 RepID=A0ABU8IWI4_9BURK
MITGASKDIGRALSNRLASDTHQVVGPARRTGDPNFPRTLVFVDLTDRNATARALICSWGRRNALCGVCEHAGRRRQSRSLRPGNLRVRTHYPILDSL